MYMRLSSDGKVITTIASARCDGGTETTEIAPVGDHGCTVPGEAGDAAGNRGQHENRDGLDAVHQAELDGGVGQLIHKPSMNYLTHPHRHGRGRLPGPEQTELTVTQRCKGPQVEQAPKGLQEPWAPLAGWPRAQALQAAMSVCSARPGDSTSGRRLVTFSSLLVSFRRPSR